MKLERLIVPFSVKAAGTDGEPMTFEGYGSIFNEIDSYGDVVAPGAFRRTLKEAKAAGRMPSLLWQHDPDEPCGVWLSMTEDDQGLLVRGKLSDTECGRDAYTLLKDGALSGLSIGFSIFPNGYKVDEKTGIRTLTAIKLWEVSLVTFPANDPARVTAVKSTLPDEREFETALRRDAGLSRAEAKRVIATCYRRLLSDAEGTTNQNPTDIAGRHVEGYQAGIAAKLQALRDEIRAGVTDHGTREAV